MLINILNKIRGFLKKYWINLLKKKTIFIIWEKERLHNLNKRTFLLLGIILTITLIIYILLFLPATNFPTKQYITIVEGENLSSISKSLEEVGVIKNPKFLELIVRLLGGQKSVDAGDYYFSNPVGIFELARIITTGKYGLTTIKIIIPEDSTVADMAEIYKNKLFKFNSDNFLKLANDKEGYLYPDTYYFLSNTKEQEVIDVMYDNFNLKIQEFSDQIKESKYTLDEIVTLASIIQKEAWKERDQKLISGVLHNRLDTGMKLQVDATFTYTHNKGTYQITNADLTDKDNLYNTYVYEGLPPGPISSFGYSALDAALNPIKSDNFFYLADRYGTTYYSKTYKQHLAKKRKYVD